MTPATAPVAEGSISELVEEYLVHCAAELSPKTANDAYGSPLRGRFLPFCAEQGITSLEQLTQPALDRFSVRTRESKKANGQPLSPDSAKSYIKAVNVFMNWARDNKGGASVKAPEPRLRKVARPVLTRDEIKRLEDAAPTERNKLIIRLLADTAAREGEIAALRTQDIFAKDRGSAADRRRFFVQFRGKTGERTCPISPELFSRLRTYAEHTRPRGLNTDQLFVGSRRRPNHVDIEPLTEVGVYRVVKDVALRAQIGRRVYPHLFRHSGITWMVNRGIHPGLISDITGVSTEVIVRHYMHASDEDRHRRRASTGWPLPGCEVRVVDPHMKDVPQDMESIGEIIIRGDLVMDGYYKEPAATAAVMTDGWFHTGDMAVWDEENFLLIMDRKKDIIISGGENISSIEVERAIAAHPSILECAVVSAPDPQWGEVPAAFVVLKPGHELSEEQLCEFLRARIAKFKMPRRFQFTADALPKTGTGKIIKRELREAFWQGKEKRIQG